MVDILWKNAGQFLKKVLLILGHTLTDGKRDTAQLCGILISPIVIIY
jgi:hypothetical protein